MLDYKVLGKDQAKEYVILLHGIGGSSNIFFPQVKAFRKDYNIIAVNLPGHKKSPSVYSYMEGFSFDCAAKDIIEILDKLNIKKAHFVGISLGSVLINNILTIAPQRVETAVLGGAITGFTPLSRTLFTLGGWIKNLMPHLWIYSLFAHILMPKSNHKESRSAFISEASQMGRGEFLGWYDIFPSVETTFKRVNEKASLVPKLYITGEEDHMFKKRLKKDIGNLNLAALLIVPGSGHVVNLDKPQAFNECSLEFIQSKGQVLLPDLEEKAYTADAQS
ncbi:alpha/beta fold hydrolase [Halobacillus litoralis]|uniref:alpha/beta fold hydrolase n=1 Tax=Halobacillus litoralis TaxID=45668 RepID=UPI001CFCEF16|nr:alpha/beta hydrolase [Halobacillus litoralis]